MPFAPKLSVLAKPQRSLWEKLQETPKSFVLYGGTAMALRLGHRQSEDFDFFSNEVFVPADLLSRIGYLRSVRIDQRGDNTLTVMADCAGPVKISFFGNLGMARVADPDIAEDTELQIASLLDLTATKVKTIQQRAEWKDYRDVLAAIDAGVRLEEAIAAAQAIYGARFNPLLTLKALTYFGDGNLKELTREEQQKLRHASSSIDLTHLPAVGVRPGIAVLK
jgi:predicted nucleotidyltransferase component of viral defense system